MAPYQTPLVNWRALFHEFMDDAKKNGQLEGIEIDIDEGLFIESTPAGLTEEHVASATVQMIKKAKEYSGTGKYDAIVSTGGLDPGFAAVRTVVSKIPVVAALHASVHVASLIGDRFSIIQGAFTSALIVRHWVERYGLGHKLVSVRCHGHPPSSLSGFLNKYKKDERIKLPEAKKVIADITATCVTAIEKDRVDSLVFQSEPMQVFTAEVRQALDVAGYEQIPIVFGLPAAVAVARTLVGMKLLQAPRDYPSHALRAVPEYW